MWRKNEDPKSAAPGVDVPPVATPQPVRTIAGLTAEVVSAPGGVLTSSIVIKGEIRGAEDLYVDGEVRGNTQLTGGRVTIGPHGRIFGDVQAHEIVVRGRVEGGLRGRDRIEIGRTGEIKGEFSASRISVEDGAQISGRAEVLGGKESPKRPAVEKAPVETLAQPLAT